MALSEAQEQYIGVWKPAQGGDLELRIFRDSENQVGWLSIELIKTSTSPKTVYCQLSKIKGKLNIPANDASGALDLTFSQRDAASNADGTPWTRTSATVPAPEAVAREKADMKLYYMAYGASLFIFITGLIAYVTANGLFTIRFVDGSALLATGIFTVLNADLLVTFIRLRREVNRFHNLNAEFSDTLDKEHECIKGLQKVKTAFAKLDEKFGGNIEKAHEAVEDLKATSQSQLKMVSGHLVKMYCDMDSNHKLDKAEVENSFATLASIFVVVLPDVEERIKHLQACVLAHQAFADGNVKILSFEHIVTEMFDMPGKDMAKEAKDAVDRALLKEKEREANLRNK